MVLGNSSCFKGTTIPQDDSSRAYSKKDSMGSQSKDETGGKTHVSHQLQADLFRDLSQLQPDNEYISKFCWYAV